MSIETLIKKHNSNKHNVTTEADKRIIAESINATKHLEGDIVDLGCFKGVTTCFMVEVLQELNIDKKVWAYDSFAGFPDDFDDKDRYDAEGNENNTINKLHAGHLKCSRDLFDEHTKDVDQTKLKVFKRFFKDIQPEELPEKICFGFFDGDIYSSVKTSFELTIPRAVDGCIMYVHDNCRHDLKWWSGASRAATEAQEKYNLESVNNTGGFPTYIYTNNGS